MSRDDVRAALADSWLLASVSRPEAGWTREVSPPAGGRAARFEMTNPGMIVEMCDVYWIGHTHAPRTYYGKRLDYFYFDCDEKLIGFEWCILD